MTTGNGRKKITMQDVLDRIEQVQVANDSGDKEGVEVLTDEVKDMVLIAVRQGDFQGLTAKVAARLALNVKDLIART